MQLGHEPTSDSKAQASHSQSTHCYYYMQALSMVTYVLHLAHVKLKGN